MYPLTPQDLTLSAITAALALILMWENPRLYQLIKQRFKTALTFYLDDTLRSDIRAISLVTGLIHFYLDLSLLTLANIAIAATVFSILAW